MRSGLLLLLAFMLGCSSSSEQENTFVQEDSTANTSSPSNKPEETTMPDASQAALGYLRELPKKWKQVTNYEEEFVFMNYCNAMTPQVELEEGGAKQESIGKLIHHLGQESEVYEIVSISKDSEQLGADIEHNYTFSLVNSNTDQLIWTLRTSDDLVKDPISLWVLGDLGGGNRMLCTSEGNFDQYPNIQEYFCPDECYEGDCPEEVYDEGLIGRGIAQMSVSPQQSINFYPNTKAKKTARVLKVDEQLVPQGNMKWLQPVVMKLDYNLLHIIVLSESDSRYEVLASTKPYRTLWLDKTAVSQYLDWQSYWTSALSIDLGVDENGESISMVSLEPQEASELVPTDRGCMKAVEVQGDWLKLTPNPDVCGNLQYPNGSGWVRWKKAGKILIRGNWLM